MLLYLYLTGVKSIMLYYSLYVNKAHHNRSSKENFSKLYLTGALSENVSTDYPGRIFRTYGAGADLRRLETVDYSNFMDGPPLFLCQMLTGCCPNPFSLGLKRFLINLRLAPVPLQRDSPRCIRKKRFNDRSKEFLFGQQPVET
jgi:hypothetical protein